MGAGAGGKVVLVRSASVALGIAGVVVGATRSWAIGVAMLVAGFLLLAALRMTE